MYLEFESSMFLLIIILVASFGYLIWKATNCKLDESFSMLLFIIVIISFSLYSYTLYNLQKDCKKVNCNRK
jgi:hypothetical protein